MEKIIGRFAPSPSGVMHLGNILSFLLSWLDARSCNGEVVFRMEDLDPDRSKAEYAKKIADDLKWLGLDWDRGWDEEHPEYAQSHRNDLYDDAFSLLLNNNCVYPCYCTRSQRLAASAPHPGEDNGAYACRCRYLTQSQRLALEAEGRKPSWKLCAPERFLSFCDLHYGSVSESAGEDFIIRRSDGVYAYQLAVSVDDIDMGIRRVVRGRDLLSSTPKQIWLIKELGAVPPEYCHTPLLVSEDQRKLSKRYGDLSMDVLREKHSPEEIIGHLAYLLGLTPDEPVSAKELLSVFSWDKIPTEDILLK